MSKIKYSAIVFAISLFMALYVTLNLDRSFFAFLFGGFLGAAFGFIVAGTYWLAAKKEIKSVGGEKWICR